MPAGNCTDYHAYIMALAHCIGVPGLSAIGAAIPSERGNGGIGGYHCWVKFHAGNKWSPAGIGEAAPCDFRWQTAEGEP